MSTLNNTGVDFFGALLGNLKTQELINLKGKIYAVLMF